MKQKCDLSKYALKPESIQLIKAAALLMTGLYAVALLLYYAAGAELDYHAALIWSERLAVGLRSGFGLLCLGLLVMECR